MRTRLPLLAAAWLAACGGPPRTGPTPPAGPPRLAATTAIPLGDDAFGPAFSPDGASILFVAGGQLHRFDAATLTKIDARPLASLPGVREAAVVLHGSQGNDAAVDLAAVARISVVAPAGHACEGTAFSADASRLSRYCHVGDDERAVVQDARTGAVIAELAEFESAAPIRQGAITDSGNFVFWWARASGAFEEIKSKVTGPMMSSHSVMAPDESALFTVPDKNWMPDDPTPAKVLDPRNGRTRYELPSTTEWVYFSADSRRFASTQLDEDRKLSAVAVHRTDDGTIAAKLGMHEVELVAFSPDAHELVIRGGGALKLYIDIP